MGKFRTRAKGGAKGERWRKGQSSISNPSKKKHREQAKGRFFQPTTQTIQSGPSKLTEESLLKHNAVLGDADDVTMDIEALTLGQTAKTFDTFASDWSQCSNINFEKFIRRFSGTNPQHRHMLAVLAAVTEVIKSQGGEESSTAYFAALMTTLEGTKDQESLTAVLSLLAMIIKAVPSAGLRSRFAMISKILMELLAQHAQEDQNSLLRSLIGCLSVLLRAQTAQAWTDSSTMRIFDSLLAFTTHTKPKVRKAAQHAVIAVLKGSSFMQATPQEEATPTEQNASSHPAAAAAAKFCVSQLEASAGSGNTALYILALLKEILSTFPKQHLKNACEKILAVMISKNSIIVSSCMHAIFGLFHQRPSKTTFPADLNAKLLTALYDYQPSVNDPQPMIAWLTVMQEGIINLCGTDQRLAVEAMKRFFKVGTHCWESDRKEVIGAATTAMKSLINECLRTVIDEVDAEDVRELFVLVEEGLKYQFHAAWQQVLSLLVVFFDVAGAKHSSLMGNCLRSLAELRSSANFTLTNEVDYTIGRAIRVMGPEIVLRFIPFDISESNYEFKRSWLLPVLRENIQNTRLAFFKEGFLPVASKCIKKAESCQQEGDQIGKKSFELLAYQLWGLLPGFCTNPIDLQESFKAIAQILGIQLKGRKELRMDIMSSLRHLILKNVDNPANRSVLANYAKNYLPILFNLYNTEPKGSEEVGQRLAAFETAKLFIQIAEPGLRTNMFDKCLEMHRSSDAPFTKDSCLDLLQYMVQFQDRERIRVLFDLNRQKLGAKDHKAQKKAYKFMEALCSSQSESCKNFVLDNLEDLQREFLGALSKASPSSQAPRLRCLIHLIQSLEDPNPAFLHQIVPEAILCIKAINEKARSTAYALIVVIGETLQKWDDSGEELTWMKEYLKVILAGLAGEPAVIHCSLLAITRLFYEYKDIFPTDLVALLVENVCLLVTSQAREIVSSALSFLKVFMTSFPAMKSARYVETVIQALTKMSEDCKRHFRLKTRYLLDRIVRKFGYDLIVGMVPKDDVTTHKRLKNIRKEQARKNRKKDEEDESDASDNDEGFRVHGKPKTMEEILADSDDDEFVDEQKSKKGKKLSTFITEGGEGIVDFLDPSAAKSVTSAKPKKEEKSQVNVSTRPRKSQPFKVGPDGRMVITEASDDDEDDVKDVKMNDSDEEEDKSFKDMVASSSALKRKRGTSISSRRTSASTAEPAMKYRAGGSGIHRPLGSEKSFKSGFGSEYKSTKAAGDVKRKGKPDPFAYVPLQRSALNKRKKAKMEGQFKGMVKAAKVGTAKGSKAKKSRMGQRKK